MRRESPSTGSPIFCPVLSPRHRGLLTVPINSSLPAAVVITKATTLQRATQIPIRSTLCHPVPQSWLPRLPQPAQATLVLTEQPQGKSLAHSALFQLQAKPARPHCPSFFLPSSFSGPPGFQIGFPGEHSVSCGWALCSSENIISLMRYCLTDRLKKKRT